MRTLYFSNLDSSDPAIPILDINAGMQDLFRAAAHSQCRCCLVVDEKRRLSGVVTQGDLLRLAEASDINDKSIRLFLSSKKKPIVALNTAQAIKHIERTRVTVVPLVDIAGKLLGVVIKDFGPEAETSDIDDQWLSVIIAGGKGERLYPLTAEVPKPLLYVGGQTMIEHVFDALESAGVRTFNLMTGHLSNKFEEFRGLSGRDFGIFVEDQPLGTGGPFLKWLREDRARIEEIVDRRGALSVVVCNADLLFDIPAEKMNEFMSGDCDVSILSRKIMTEIKYGVITETHEGLLEDFEEKPVLHHMVNTGIYFFKIDHERLRKFDEISVKSIDMPQLIIALRDEKNLKVCVHEIKGNYIDLGTKEDLQRVTNFLKE